MSQKAQCPWQTLFAWSEGPYYGYVRDMDSAVKIIHMFSYTTGTSYIVTRASKHFGNFDILESGTCLHTIRFEDRTIKHGTKINLGGCPFMLVGAKLMECHQGPSHRQQPMNNKPSDHSYEQQRKTKKNVCNAAIHLRELITFPQYKIETSLELFRKRKIEKSEQLRTDMQSTNYEEIETEKLIFINLPSPAMHTGHETGDAADIKAPIDRRVVNHINKMVDEGITNVTEMKSRVKTYVNNLFEPNDLPRITSRRFFPSRDDVRKLMYRRQRQNRHNAEHTDTLRLTKSLNRCRDILTKMTDLTSTVESVCALDKAAEDLYIIYRRLQSSCPPAAISKNQTPQQQVVMETSVATAACVMTLGVSGNAAEQHVAWQL